MVFLSSTTNPMMNEDQCSCWLLRRTTKKCWCRIPTSDGDDSAVWRRVVRNNLKTSIFFFQTSNLWVLTLYPRKKMSRSGVAVVVLVGEPFTFAMYYYLLRPEQNGAPIFVWICNRVDYVHPDGRSILRSESDFA